MRQPKLDLLNDRFYRPGDAPTTRVYDSTEELVWKAPERDSRDTQIPFLMRPKVVRSFYSDWRTGKIKLESGEAPIMDNKGRYFGFGKELKEVKFTERQLRSVDFGENEAARIYYCKPERMDCPSMNKVLDGLHHVKGETIEDRVKLGKVAGASWTDVPRFRKEKSNTADIGPGHYDIHRYNDKFGPTHSNLLMLSEVDSGRGEEVYKKATPAMRRKERNLRIMRENNPPKKPEKELEESGLLEATSSLESGFNIDLSTGSKRFATKVEPYVKTSGGKLDLDYDPHLDRTRMPVSFSQSPKFAKLELPLTIDTNYTVNYGKKMDIVTAAISSPVTYSAAFKSNAPVGMVTKAPTSGNAAIFEGIAGAIEIRDPSRKNATFLAKRGSCFEDIPPTAGTHQKFKDFSEEYTAGPFFPKGSSGAANVQKEKTLHQIKTLYPQLYKKLHPPPPRVEKKDPFAYLKPKIK